MKNVLHHETERKQAEEKGKKVQPHRRKYPRRNRFLGPAIKGTILLGLVLAVLGTIFFLNTGNGTTSNTTQAGAYPFVVGKPGPGELAPAIHLPSTAGKEFDLAAMRGKTVLLFFQEGLGCQSCWTQIQDIEANMAAFRSLGIDTMVSITTNPLDALKQEVANERISTPVLSDQNFLVSRAYSADQYGMMSGSSDGHSFLLVGPDGRIRWRADYGGPPKYTMYIPIPTLVASMREGLNGK